MWLVANDLEVYAEEFSNKNIDGKQLLNLDGSKLKVRLGFYPSLKFGKIFKGELFFLLNPRPTCFGLKAEATSGEPAGKNFCAGHYKDLAETGNRARQVSGTQGRLIWKTVRISGKVPATPLTQKPLLHDLII